MDSELKDQTQAIQHALGVLDHLYLCRHRAMANETAPAAFMAAWHKVKTARDALHAINPEGTV